jgi:hypothetical protein
LGSVVAAVVIVVVVVVVVVADKARVDSPHVPVQSPPPRARAMARAMRHRLRQCLRQLHGARKPDGVAVAVATVAAEPVVDVERDVHAGDEGENRERVRPHLLFRKRVAADVAVDVAGTW